MRPSVIHETSALSIKQHTPTSLSTTAGLVTMVIEGLGPALLYIHIQSTSNYARTVWGLFTAVHRSPRNVCTSRYGAERERLPAP